MNPQTKTKIGLDKARRNLHVSRFTGYNRTLQKLIHKRYSTCDANKVPNWICDCSTDFVPVSFAGGIASRILNPRDSEFIQNKILSIWSHGRKNFPGTLAASLMPEDLSTLKLEDYRCVAKTNGTRYMMYCFVDADEEPRVAMMDRSGAFHLVELSFDNTVFHGTIVDGEMVRNAVNDVWEFHIFDCVFHSGLRVHRMNYDDRLRHCSLLEGQYTRSPSDTFVPVCKAILTVEQARDMVTVHDPSAVAAGLEPYGIDGLVLVPALGAYMPGIDRKLYKVKYRHLNTVDMQVSVTEKSKDTIRLTAIDPDPKSPSHVSNVQNEKVTPDLLKRLNVKNALHLDSRIVECQWSQEKVRWVVEKLRSDKSLPNNIDTIAKTLRNIQEYIPFDTVFGALVYRRGLSAPPVEIK